VAVDEVLINGRRYRVPEKIIVLDFWNKLNKVDEHSQRYILLFVSSNLTECFVSIRDEVASDLSSPLTELSSLDDDDVSSIEMVNGGFDEHAAAQVNSPSTVCCQSQSFMYPYRFSLASPLRGNRLMLLGSLICRRNLLIVRCKQNANRLLIAFLPRTRLGDLGK
jgi:hypothetical protein